MVTPDTGVLSTPECREIMHVDILVKKNFLQGDTREVNTVLSGYCHSGSCFSVSTFPEEVMKWESHQTCMHRTGKKRVKQSWPGGNPVASADHHHRLWSVPPGGRGGRCSPERSTKVQVTGPILLRFPRVIPLLGATI